MFKENVMEIQWPENRKQTQNAFYESKRSLNNVSEVAVLQNVSCTRILKQAFLCLSANAGPGATLCYGGSVKYPGGRGVLNVSGFVKMMLVDRYI